MRGADTPRRQRDPVDLVLENRGLSKSVRCPSRKKGRITDQISMLLRRYPNMTVTPYTKLPKLLDLGVTDIGVVFHWKPLRVENTHIASKSEKNARRLISHKSRVRSALTVSS